MDAAHLEANLVALLKDVTTIRPRRPGKFVSRVLLKCPPSSETLKIDPFVYISEEYVKTGKGVEESVEDAEDEAQEDKEAVASN